MNWLTYANQGATRNQPLSDDLANALAFLPELGVTAKVFSGGQPAKGSGAPRVGSTRHDHGNAADVFFYRDGRRLDWSNPDDLPMFQEIVQRGREAGLTGFGAGEGYMQPGSMHIGFGDPAVWGADGKGANAPEWLRRAYYGADATQQPGGDYLLAVDQRSRPAEQRDDTMDRLAVMNALAQFMPRAPTQDVRNFLVQQQPQQSVGFGPGTNPFMVG